MEIQVLNPLTIEQMIARDNAKGNSMTTVEYLSPSDILDKYGDILSDEQRDALLKLGL